MTLQEIKHIIAIKDNYHEDISEHVLEFEEKVYNPVKEAIANNNTIVIEYLESCTQEERYGLCTAIERGLQESQAVNEGIIREGYDRAVNLYRVICEENNYPIKL
jgi:hypothetical protein